MDMYVCLFLLALIVVFAVAVMFDEIRRETEIEQSIREIELANYYGMSVKEFREWKEN